METKNKKIDSTVIFWLVVVIFIAGALFFTILSDMPDRSAETLNNQGVSNKKESSDDKISYLTNNGEFIIDRDKVTKEARVTIKYRIKDEDEYKEGEIMTPSIVMFGCVFWSNAIFDAEEMRKSVSPEANKDYEKLAGYLEGYAPKKMKIFYIDGETNEDIATCEAVEANERNIKFEVFRDYDPSKSFLGIEIGKWDYQE